MPPELRPIPQARFGYANGVLGEIARRGPLTAAEIATAPPERLFKGQSPNTALDRVKPFLFIGTGVGFVVADGDRVDLTPHGREYVHAGSAENPFEITEAQGAVMREVIAQRWGELGMLYGVVLALSLWASTETPEEYKFEDFGRALATAAGKEGWFQRRTFHAQAERGTTLLQDIGALDLEHRPTPAGQALLARAGLPAHPSLDDLLQTGAQQVWVMRAGEGGRHERIALDHSVAMIGWERLPPLDTLTNDQLFAELAARYEDLYEGNNRRIGQARGTITTFTRRVRIGDFAILPLYQPPRHVAVGIVRSGYKLREEPEFHDDNRHTRDVDWIAREVPYDAFAPELVERFSMRSVVGQIHIADAAQLVRDALAPIEPAYWWVSGTEAPADADRVLYFSDGVVRATDDRELAEPIPLHQIPREWRDEQGEPFDGDDVLEGEFALSEAFFVRMLERFPRLRAGVAPDYVEPPLAEIAASIRAAGMQISDRMIRRYHVALKTRGFVILSGVSGTGKTWLGELYARAVGAQFQLVSVAPNWTTNEDLLGYLNPLANHYHDTLFSQFLRDAAAEFHAARDQSRTAKPYHVVLDEMNLARVEYYFAKFLSAMEVRARAMTAAIDLAPGHSVELTPNVFFIGTVNVDETTHGFADKVYDRAQLIEFELQRSGLARHLGDAPHREFVLSVWDAVADVAPFAYRTLVEIERYTEATTAAGASLDEALDEVVLQKVLPKLRGSDVRLGAVLARLVELTAAGHPLSHAKVVGMRTTFEQHGFTSFF